MSDLKVVLPEQSAENENTSAETISSILGSGSADKRTLEIAEIIACHDRPNLHLRKARGKPDGSVFKAVEAVPHPNRFNIPASQLERLKQEHEDFCIVQDINWWPLCLFCRYIPKIAHLANPSVISYKSGVKAALSIGKIEQIELGYYKSNGEIGFAKTFAYQSLGLPVSNKTLVRYADEIPTVSLERREEIKVQVLYYLQRKKWDRTKNASEANSARPEQGREIQSSVSADGSLLQEHR